ncbi:MAG: GTPase [Lachnospiraceae bacterium]|nr:GTPase [Lachnospiraceae bacterium]
MFNRKKEMLIYVILGFLEAGKTSLIKDLLQQDLFDLKSKTLVLACEEGEEEYEPAFLAKVGASLAEVEEEDDFTAEGIKEHLKKYNPDRLVIEYNGMWRTTKVVEFYREMSELLFDREVYIQVIDVVNDETFNLYMKNMPSLMTEHFKLAQLVIDNRCTVEKTKRLAVRGSVKGVNPRCQVSFESQDPMFYQMEDELPFNIKKEPIDVPFDEFGTWYTDMMEHTNNYEGKTVILRGMIQKMPGLKPGFAVFGRRVMTCCADDIQFIGFLAKYDKWDQFNDKDYVAITAKMEYAYRKEYGEKGPVFYLENAEKIEKPADDLAYFN